MAKRYEFKGDQERVIRGLAGPMMFVARAQIACGIVCGISLALALIKGEWGEAVGAATSLTLTLLPGLWRHRSAVSFRAIAQTEGDDVGHLMTALSELGRVYRFERTLMLVAGLLVVGAIALLATGLRLPITQHATGRGPSRRGA